MSALNVARDLGPYLKCWLASRPSWTARLTICSTTNGFYLRPFFRLHSTGVPRPTTCHSGVTSWEIIQGKKTKERGPPGEAVNAYGLGISGGKVGRIGPA